MDIESFQYLSITSGLKKKFGGAYHGVSYEFKPGEAVTVPIDAARHIFGFGEDDKSTAWHRLGWLTSSNDLEFAQKKNNLMKFEPVDQIFELRGARERRGLTIDGDPSTGAPKIHGDETGA